MAPVALRPFPSRLYAIVDADVAARAGWDVPDLADAYLQAGVRVVQVRAKDAAARDILTWTESIARRAGDAWVIVNDRADIACVARTRHVHLGQDDLPVPAARALLGGAAVIGLSTHTRTQAEHACRLPLDYIAVGPIFGTATKATGHDAVGLTLLRDASRAAAAAGLPVVAIGGITLDTAPEVIAAGASAVAVITDLLHGGNPGARARAYVERLGRV